MNGDEPVDSRAPNNKELYQVVDEWDGETMYRYIVIGVVVIFVSTKLGTMVSFLIGLIIAYQILNYMNYSETLSNVRKDDLYKKKVNSIIPKLNRTTSYEKVTNLIFTIQDMYRYNPLAFYEINKRIEDFFDLYEKIERSHAIAHLGIDQLIDYKRSILNCMHSLLFSLPTDQNMAYKLNRTIGDMDTELSQYIDNVSYLIDDDIYKNGYTRSTKLYEPIYPSNRYRDIDLPFTYEIY